jgi:hypothetical protein
MRPPLDAGLVASPPNKPPSHRNRYGFIRSLLGLRSLARHRDDDRLVYL